MNIFSNFLKINQSVGKLKFENFIEVENPCKIRWIGFGNFFFLLRETRNVIGTRTPALFPPSSSSEVPLIWFHFRDQSAPRSFTKNICHFRRVIIIEIRYNERCIERRLGPAFYTPAAFEFIQFCENIWTCIGFANKDETTRGAAQREWNMIHDW